ncbi:hypothetical protein CI238_03077 [Colletotrichum incanum]|uniref:Uncharacterized protein n=1 Tax=Colletotrichum incanum TaxID=1573173 RepID=A0A166RC24_COLIC|nr:hypothetical protein CI238_03077 [Colletotrichum incanum]OHW95075.1 hypothetical protein CSPAE12_06345 [Colletotrichum incanum]
MSAQIEYNQMPREPAPAVLSEQKFSAEQPRPNQPMTMDQTTHLRGGRGGDGGRAHLAFISLNLDFPRLNARKPHRPLSSRVKEEAGEADA